MSEYSTKVIVTRFDLWYDVVCLFVCPRAEKKIQKLQIKRKAKSTCSTFNFIASRVIVPQFLCTKHLSIVYRSLFERLSLSCCSVRGKGALLLQRTVRAATPVHRWIAMSVGCGRQRVRTTPGTQPWAEPDRARLTDEVGGHFGERIVAQFRVRV